MTKRAKAFANWLNELNCAATQRGYKGDIATDTGSDYWGHYFDDGYSPESALDEDFWL